MAATLIMSRFSLEQGLFGCCSSCHAAFGEELNAKTWASRDRQFPFTTSRSLPLPAAVASARGGDERSDWTPRAAVASGHPLTGSSPSMLATPPPALLVDVPAGAQRPRTPPAARDPAAKALERARLRQLVNEFTQEAASGRPCSIVVLDGDMGECNGGGRREARYTLSDEVDRFILLGRRAAQQRHADAEAADNNEAEWEPLGQWPLEAVLGIHKAEESALVQSHQRDLGRSVSREEIARAAVLEFGGGTFAGCVPLLLIEESTEHIEKFVSGMQILRLYKGATHRLETARISSERRSNSPAPAVASLFGQLPAAPESVPTASQQEAPSGSGKQTPDTSRIHSARLNRPAGLVGSDDPAADMPKAGDDISHAVD